MNSSSSGRNVKHIDVKAQCHLQIEDVAISCGEGSCSPINYQCGNFGGAGSCSTTHNYASPLQTQDVRQVHVP